MGIKKAQAIHAVRFESASMPRSTLVSALLVLLCQGCVMTPPIPLSDIGDKPDRDMLNSLQTGETTKDEAIALLGEPTNRLVNTTDLRFFLDIRDPDGDAPYLPGWTAILYRWKHGRWWSYGMSYGEERGDGHELSCRRTYIALIFDENNILASVMEEKNAHPEVSCDDVRYGL